MKDFYQVLGVPRGAVEADIKKAYRRLAKQYHPDVNKGDKGAEERFKEISEAYSVLSDPEKKKQYDMFGPGAFHGGFDPSQRPEGFRWSNEAGPQGYYYTTSGGQAGFNNFDGFDLGEIFGDLFNMGGAKRGPRRRAQYQTERPSGPVNGSDTYITLEVSFEEAINGTSTRLSIKRGDSIDKISVKIPSGVDNGSKVRVAGKGNPGIHGGKNGDLYLNIRVRPHKVFWREGSDIFVEVPVSIYEAVLGGKVEVPTIDGSAKMTIPPGTSSGQKFRLKGKGSPVLGKGGIGDQYVIVKINVPEKIDDETQRIFEELSKKKAYNPRG